MKTKDPSCYRNKLDHNALLTVCKSRVLSFDPELESSLVQLNLASVQKAQEDLGAFLLSLPSDFKEVKHRCVSESLFVLRAILFTYIDQDLLTLEEADQLAPLCRVLGLGKLETCVLRWFKHEKKAYDHCKNKALKISKTQFMRLERGLSILFHSPSGQMLFEQLNEADRVLLSGPWVRPMFRLAEHELFPRYAIFALYKSTPEAQRLDLLMQFEKCRRRVRVQALPAYEKLITELNLAELDFLLAHFEALNELDDLKTSASYLPEYIQIAIEHMRTCVDEVS